MMLPFRMPIVDLHTTARELGQSGRQVKVLWQEDESLAFVAQGRDYRSEFHINPSDELMYQISGTMRLHYRTPEGKEDVAVVTEGSIIYTPAGTPHSPRFPGDAYALIVERRRRPALDDEGVRVAGEAWGVGRAGRRIDDRALGDHRHVLFALGRPVVEPHRPRDLVHQLVARVDVKLAPIVAPL